MTILYKHDIRGAFIAGDTVTKMTCYAYPTSANAQQARKAPDKVAREMLKNQTRHYGSMHEANYDHDNWERLAGRKIA